jgi:hypothetical protein
MIKSPFLVIFSNGIKGLASDDNEEKRTENFLGKFSKQ